VHQAEPQLCYQLPGSVRNVVLEDDAATKQEVIMRQSYFVLYSQKKDLNFTPSLLPRSNPPRVRALGRVVALRPYVRLTATELVAFDQLRLTWLKDEQAWIFINKIDSWKEGAASTAV
jgi:hypothetical protein